MLDVTSSTESSDEPQDSADIWNKSPEFKAVKSKLAQLRNKFSAEADLLNVSETSGAVQQSAPGFDAMALQRESIFHATRLPSLTSSELGAFYKYLCLENMQLPAASTTVPLASWLTNRAAVQTPAYLS
jgi:hypothetical protein